jgi:S-adenosylmethionine/arginine decarboxylase-like enzyme
MGMIKCPCGFKAENDSRFTWTTVGSKLVLLCWDCTDSLHKEFARKYMKDMADMEEIVERAATFIEETIEREKEAHDCN